jgi:hypothetical protein
VRRHILAATAAVTALTLPLATAATAAETTPTTSSRHAITRIAKTTNSICEIEASGTAQHAFWETHVDDTRRYRTWDWLASADIPGPKAISGTNVWVNTKGAEFYQRFFSRNGHLYFDRTKYVSDTNRMVSRRWEVATSGWKHKTRIVNVADTGDDSMQGYMYGLAPGQGRIYRYQVTKDRGAVAPVVTYAGRKGGYPGLKSLSLAGRSGSNTILLGTTGAGKLRMITIPDSSTFDLSITTVRDSGFEYFDYLATDNKCGGPNRLIAVNPDTHKAKLFDISITSGQMSVPYLGLLHNGWPYRLTAPLSREGSYPVLGS